jgi:hypothetical protein
VNDAGAPDILQIQQARTPKQFANNDDLEKWIRGKLNK